MVVGRAESLDLGKCEQVQCAKKDILNTQFYYLFLFN